MTDVTQLLIQYGDLTAHQDALRLSIEAKRAEIMRIIKDDLDALEAETAPQFSAIQDAIAAITEEIKAETARGGQSIKGDRFQAVYTKGRVAWDTKALEGYAAAHPEIQQFKKVGEPSVSIRLISTKE